MDDTTCDNLINFNASPVHKFVPLVPLPSEGRFLASGEMWPFDNVEAGGGPGDPFEVVLRSITGQSPCGGLQEASQSRIQPCVQESSEPPRGDCAPGVDVSRCAGRTVRPSRPSVGDLLSVRVHEKLDGCIQMMLNGSSSQQQKQSRGVDARLSMGLLGNVASANVDVSSSGLPSTPSRGLVQGLCHGDNCVVEKYGLNPAPDYCCPQVANMASSKGDRVAWEALRVANSISHNATGDFLDETLDDIKVELLSSDEEDEEFVEQVQLYKPLPLNMERMSGLALRRPEPLDHCKLVTRLKELKAANHLPEGKPGPLRAIVPVADMGKVAATSCAVAGGRNLPSKILCSSLPAESRQNNPRDVEVKTSALRQCKQPASAKSTPRKSLLRSPGQATPVLYSSANTTNNKAGMKGRGLPVYQARSSLRAMPSSAVVTVEDVAAPRDSARTSRRVSNSPKASIRVAGGGGCGVPAVARRSKSASNATPMRSVENQVAGGRRADKGSPFMKQRTPVRAVRNKENIFPA